jgi:hypothetical protein
VTLTFVRATCRGLVAAAVAVLLASCANTSATPSPSPDVYVATPPPPPRTTPPGTPAPTPSVAIATSASIDIPTPPPNATATPSPEPGLWRIQGYVVDDGGAPLSGACVVIGPKGCQPYSPHTDDQGHYFIDVAEGKATFDFYFETPGHQTVWLHITPTGPAEFNVILAKG